MRIVRHDFHTDIFLTNEEVKDLCKPGHGAETCVWLVMGSEGFECLYLNQPPMLIDQWQKGLTVAKRDGCEKVKSLA